MDDKRPKEPTEEKANKIARAALVVSILSFVLSFVTAVNQYREDVKVTVTDMKVLFVEDNLISLEAECIVANTSQSTVSLITASAFWNSQSISAESDVPLTLVSGYAEKVAVRFKYTLSDDELEKWKNGESLNGTLDTARISIRFKSAKGKLYSHSYKIDEINAE